MAIALVLATLLSKAFTGLVNPVTGRRLTDYNGLQIHRSDVLRQLSIQSLGYGFQAESHAVNGFRKLAAFEGYAPTHNVSALTARANDGRRDSTPKWELLR